MTLKFYGTLRKEIIVFIASPTANRRMESSGYSMSSLLSRHRASFSLAMIEKLAARPCPVQGAEEAVKQNIK